MCLSGPQLELFAPAVLMWTGALIAGSCIWARTRASRAWSRVEPLPEPERGPSYRGVDESEAPTGVVRGHAVAGAELGLVWRLGLFAALLLSPLVTAACAGFDQADALGLRSLLGLAGASCWLSALALIRASPRYFRLAAWTSKALSGLGVVIGAVGFVVALLACSVAPLLGLIAMLLVLLVVSACFSTLAQLDEATLALRRSRRYGSAPGGAASSSASSAEIESLV